MREGCLFQGRQLNGTDHDFAVPVTEDITLTARWTESPPFGAPDFTLPDGIRTIEANAFEGAAMTVVTVPDGCELIGDHAFRDCARRCGFKMEGLRPSKPPRDLLSSRRSLLHNSLFFMFLL